MTTKTATLAPSYRANIDWNYLPQLETATDVIEFLGMQVADMVAVLIIDTEGDEAFTPERFNSAFARTFDAALPELFRRLDKVRPGLADWIRAHFVAEYEARPAA